MNDASDPQVVRSYLAQLDSALAGVPADVRRDILAGVAEELRGLDAAAAASRIEQLGDPAFIAAEARAEARTGASSHPDASTTARADIPFGMTARAESGLGRGSAAKPPASTQRWYIVVTALLIDFGFLVLPLAGWVLGIMLMWSSPLWSRREKLYITLAPPAAGTFFGLIVAIVQFAMTGRMFTPTGLSSWNFVVGFGVIPIVVAIGTGIYLSRRGWERTA